jgi:hypothetical protein
MNQPPQTEKQTDKRIVSKGEYVKAQGKRAGLNMLGWCLLLAAVGLGLFALAEIFLMIVFTQPSPYMENGPLNAKDLLYGGMMVLAIVGIAFLCGKFGRKSLDHAHQIDIFLTHANTAALPAQDSLVRASEEPVQEQ